MKTTLYVVLDKESYYHLNNWIFFPLLIFAQLVDPFEGSTNSEKIDGKNFFFSAVHKDNNYKNKPKSED